MKQFLFSSIVFGKKRFSVQVFKQEEMVEKINYLLTHRQDAVFWPLFTKADIKECLPMDQSLPSLLQGMVVGSAACKIRYNGGIYQVDEIVPSNELKGYWCVRTPVGDCLLDPNNIEFL